jgi:hypothetical protein
MPAALFPVVWIQPLSAVQNVTCLSIKFKSITVICYSHITYINTIGAFNVVTFGNHNHQSSKKQSLTNSLETSWK